MMFSAALVCVCVLACACVKTRALERRLSALDGEVSRMWDRLEWLCKDTDDRLSVDRVELQQRAMQIKNLQKRVKRAEGFLYIDARDAFKEDADGKGKEVEP